ncbi:MAG: Gfo/Idh/MocA family oxidoreductase [Labilithrix sp.]
MNALVVGSGWARMTGEVFAARDGVRVAGVVARGSPRSFALARELGAPLFTSLAEAIAETRPTLAVVAVGDADNPLLSRDLLEAGSHVLCAHPVARTPEQVADLAHLARERRLIAATDYSMRLTPPFLAALGQLAGLGDLLRVDITFPGRFLPIALDLAMGVAGSVDALSAFGQYPAPLAVPRSATPSAYSPTIVLEHSRGVVTALTPTPHATPSSAIRITTSSTRGRLDIGLPAGGARRVRMVSTRAGYEEEVLLDPEVCDDARQLYRTAMQRVADAFVDAATRGGPPPCPLETEVEVRRLWRAIPVALRTQSRVEIA